MARQAHKLGSGPSQRQLRVGELIRRALSEALTRGAVHDPDLDGVSITVGEVRTSPDLRQATVFVLPLGGTGAERVLEALNRNRGELRRLVNRAVSLKFSPELRFQTDTSFDRMDATRALLSDPSVARDLGED
ncbi:MAG: 30S ribosome-binding factor RbfA [Pseudomonadota bacterium]